MTSSLLESVLAVAIIAFMVILIYAKAKKQSIGETIREVIELIKEQVGNKK
jgi:uncharacterized protein YoxC